MLNFWVCTFHALLTCEGAINPFNPVINEMHPHKLGQNYMHSFAQELEDCSSLQPTPCRWVHCVSCAVPNPPTIADVIQTDLTTVTLSWTAPEVTNGNITHFEVILSNEGAAMNETSAVVPANSTPTTYSATFERLTEFQRYSYRVRGFSEDGPGNYSNLETLTLGMWLLMCSLEWRSSVYAPVLLWERALEVVAVIVIYF